MKSANARWERSWPEFKLLPVRYSRWLPHQWHGLILAGPLIRCHGQRWQVQARALSQYSERIQGPPGCVAALQSSMEHYWIMLSFFFFPFLFHYSIKEHDRSEGDRFLLHNTCWIWRTNVIVGCHGRVAVRLHSSEYDFWSLRKY